MKPPSLTRNRDHSSSLHFSLSFFLFFFSSWGRGIYGRLGYDSSNNVGNSTQREMAELPYITFRDNTVKAISISCGGYHSCALFENGRIFCWGRAGFGALGQFSFDSIGDVPGSMTSYPYISFNNSDSADKVSAGYTHT